MNDRDDNNEAPYAQDPAASAAYQPGPGHCVGCGDHDPELDHRGLCPICDPTPEYGVCKRCGRWSVCMAAQCATCTQLASTYQAALVDGFNIGGADMLDAIQRITAASASLLVDVDAMRLPEPNTAPSGPYWLGPFDEWSEEMGDRDEHQVGIKWPNLVISCTKLRQEVEAAKRGRPAKAQDLAQRIRAFDVDCTELEHTDTCVAWELLTEAADLLWKEGA